jgi:hypothetical protein
VEEHEHGGGWVERVRQGNRGETAEEPIFGKHAVRDGEGGTRVLVVPPEFWIFKLLNIKLPNFGGGVGNPDPAVPQSPHQQTQG